MGRVIVFPLYMHGAEFVNKMINQSSFFGSFDPGVQWLPIDTPGIGSPDAPELMGPRMGDCTGTDEGQCVFACHQRVSVPVHHNNVIY